MVRRRRGRECEKGEERENRKLVKAKVGARRKANSEAGKIRDGGRER